MPSRSITQANTTGYDNVIPPIRYKKNRSQSTTASVMSDARGTDHCIEVKAVSLTNMLLDGSDLTIDTIDVTNDLVLINGQTNATQNGIYEARSTGYIRWSPLTASMLVMVQEGSSSETADTLWMLENDSDDLVIGTSNISFRKIIEDTYKVKVNSADSTAEYLWDKLSIGDYITFSVVDVAGVKHIQIFSDDKRFRISGTDDDENYADIKLTASTGIGKSIGTPGGSETLDFHLDNFADLTGLTLTSIPISIPVEDSAGNIRKVTESQFRSLLNRDWVRETLDNDSTIAVTDTTNTVVSLTCLNPADSGFSKHKHLTWGYDDTLARCLGRISHFGFTGGSYTEAQLVSLHGTELVVSGQDYSSTDNNQCWFSILLDAVNNADSFGVVYQVSPTMTSIDLCINATFEFWYPPGTNNPLLAKWVLKSYETLRTWHKRYVLGRINAPTGYSWTIADLPFEGYYDINVYLMGDNIRTSTICGTLYQPLGILYGQGSGDVSARYLDMDSWFNMCFGVGVEPDFDADVRGNSLQGSAHVHVTGVDCSTRTITITVSRLIAQLPETNVDINSYMGANDENNAYCHVVYLGKLEGHECSEFVVV